MPVQKIKSGRVAVADSTTYVGEHGTIFYNEFIGDLRLSDGTTPGGVPLSLGGGGTLTLLTATTTRLGGIKVGNNLTISADGTLSAVSSGTFGTIVVNGQPSLTSSSSTTALEFVAGPGIVITTTSTSTVNSIVIESNYLNATLDGGHPTSVYGGLAIVDGGGI